MTVPLSLTGKYQLVVLGQNGNAEVNACAVRLVNAVSQAFDKLGVKAMLRDYIKATVGFEKLGEATDTPAKSLIRMFGPRGNRQARNLFGIIGYLQKQAGIELHVTPQVR